ncbi:MAG TPA: response regulator [Pyrinomonadaceae bacterium]|nr:response regulator [Pyrinomonadaceae bacterium]
MELQTATRLRPAIHVLLVEDNPADARLTTYSLGASSVPLNVSLVTNGDEALAFLRREGRYRSAAAPDLVLLDLNMPKKNGFETLMEIRKDPKLSSIPVLILTSSDDEADVARSYSLQANAYLVKPFGIEKFSPVVKAVEDFWFKTAKLPPRDVAQQNRE